MKKLSLVLFSLILSIACVFSYVSIPKSSVSSETITQTIYPNSTWQVECVSDHRNISSDFYGYTIENTFGPGSISADIYNEILADKPEISLYSFVLTTKILAYDKEITFNCTFEDLQPFTYCENIDEIQTYNYSFYKPALGGGKYVILFAMPFEFSFSTDLSETLVYSGDEFQMLNTYAIAYVGFSNLQTSYTNINTGNCSYTCHAGSSYTSRVTTYVNHSVEFLDYQGNVLKSQSIKTGEYASVPTAPTREGYDFIGWTSSVNGVGVTSAITQDVTFTATYKVKTYNVNYVDYDNTSISSQTIDYGNVSIVPSNPIRTGYTFSHWESSVIGIDTNSVIKQDVTFTAVYTINQYNVEFKNEDGTLIESKIYNYNVLPTCSLTPSKTGYTFIGWYDENNNVLSNVNADVVYFPKFEINKYNVVFKDYNGTQISSQVVEYNKLAVVPNNPNRVGYTFSYWQSDVDLVVGSPITSDVVYTAHYNINYYNVTLYDYLKSDEPIIFSVAYNTNLEAYVNSHLSDFNYGMDYYNYQGLQFDLYLVNGIQANFIAKYNVEKFVSFEELYITEDIELIKEYYLPLYFEILFNDDTKYTNVNLTDLNGLSRFKTQFFEDKFLNTENLTNYAIDIIQYYDVKKQGYDEEYINVKSDVLKQFGNSSIFDFNYLDIVNLKGQIAQINILEIEYFPIKYTAHFYYDVGNLRGHREYSVYYNSYISEHYVNWYESGDEFFSHWVQVDYFDADDFINDNSQIINDSPIFPVKCNGDMYFKAIKVAMSSDVPLQDNFNYKQLYLETWDFEEQTGGFFERLWGSVTDSIENVVMLLPRVAYNFFVWLVFESPIFSDLLDIISGGALKLIFMNISFTLNLIEISFIGPLCVAILLLLFGFKWLI